MVFRKMATLASVGVVMTLLCYFAFRDRPVQISFQGEQYIKGAWSLQETGDFGPGRGDLARYGPLYSILLAGLGKLGYSPGHAVVLLNAVVLSASFVVFYFVAGLLDVRRPWIATIFYATLASNVYFFRMARPDAIVPLMAMLTVWGVGYKFTDRLAG